jgi:hypothetical protein
MTNPGNKDNGEGMQSAWRKAQSGKAGFRIQVSGDKYRKQNAVR